MPMSLISKLPTRAPEASANDAPPAVDASFLEGLIGYNARRAAISIIGVFLERMAPYGMRVVDFSILTLIAHNPGITSRQLSATLAILPPNLVGMVQKLQARGLIEKRPQPHDRRAHGLHVTTAGHRLQAETQEMVSSLETDVVTHLTDDERQTLICLLRKVYKSKT